MNKTRLLFCMMRQKCDMVSMLHRAVQEAEGPADGKRGGYVETPPIAARLLRLTFVSGERNTLEEWVRISGDPRVMDFFIERLRASSRYRVSVVYRNKFSAVLRIRHRIAEHCLRCPMIYLPSGVMPKTVILLPEGKLVELIAVGRGQVEKLEEMGFEVLTNGGINSMDYMITPTQESALIYAYRRGYYRFPRGVSLKKLAEELGMSISSLAELLRKAEAKIVEAFIRHEMPHHLVYTVLRKAIKEREREEVASVPV